MPVPTDRRLHIAAAVLFLLALAYLAYGAAATVRTAGKDAIMRWTETRYVLDGRVPYWVLMANADALPEHRPAKATPAAESTTPPPPGADTGVIEGVGVPEGFYPPWSYPTGLPLFAVPRGVLGVWMIVVDLAMLGVLLAYARHAARAAGLGTPAVIFLVAAVAGMSAHGQTVKIGQLGLVVAAGIAGMLWLLERPVLWRSLAAGLLLGVAIVKPILAAPFLGVPVVKGRWVTAGVAVLYVALASLVTWAWTGLDPLTWLAALSEHGSHFAHKGFGPQRLLERPGIDREAAMQIIALTVAGLTAVVMIARRRASPLALAAVAATAARFWTYHKTYDDTILAFPLLAVGLLALTNGGRPAWAAFLALGLSLWLPFRLPGVPEDLDATYGVAVQVLQVIALPLAAALVILRPPAGVGPPSSPRA